MKSHFVEMLPINHYYYYYDDDDDDDDDVSISYVLRLEKMFGLVYSPSERVTTSHHGSQYFC